MSLLKLYVPKGAEADRGTDNPHEFARIAFGNYWGGWTEYDARGGWIDGNGEPVREPVTVFECVTDGEHADTDKELLKALARRVLERTTEDAVLAVHDGEKIMVSGE